jgi:hypothetical protein
VTEPEELGRGVKGSLVEEGRGLVEEGKGAWSRREGEGDWGDEIWEGVARGDEILMKDVDGKNEWRDLPDRFLVWSR